MTLSLSEKFILGILDQPILNRKDLDKSKRQFCKIEKSEMLTNNKILEAYHNLLLNKIIEKDPELEKILTLKNTRSLSGIVVLSVLTKPYECPGKCLYCPTEKDVPKSYFSNEPAVMRAIMCKYDPYLQTISRLTALDAVGHITEKVNIRIIGGTWSFYPKSYQTWFIKRVFEAVNNFRQQPTYNRPNKDLFSLQSINETSEHRIVEISVETRQDYINKAEVRRLRWLGVTKVELGVQSIYDEVLKFNNRGNTDNETVKATKLLKDAGFKVSYQMMLNLPASNPDLDLSMFKTMFEDSRYQPDHMKIYPMALVRESGAYALYQAGKYKPYTKEELIDLICKIKQHVPYYCRIERVIRDIPADSIVEGGSKISNLRQEVEIRMTKNGEKCNCIRCREVKGKFDESTEYKIFRQDYASADGTDIFLSVESLDRSQLYTMLRLRIPSQYYSKSKHFIKILDQSSIIREIHTYGPQVKIGGKNDQAAQHHGFGKLLVNEAEKISKKEFGIKKIAVIAGIGVREYFKKLGYSEIDTYMVKDI
jgi:elongator complex protein 3